MKKSIAISVVVFLILTTSCKMFDFARIDNDLSNKIKNGAVILDVRPPKDFQFQHINGAVNIPLNNLEAGYIQLDTNKVYITCSSKGLRSVTAKRILREKGFDQVYNGGDWFELEKVVLNNAK
jgi:phage shock protein E